MGIAHLLVVKCKFDIIIDRTLCNYMARLCIVACRNLVFYYQFIHTVQKHFVALMQYSVTTQNFIVLSYLHHPKAQILLCG